MCDPVTITLAKMQAAGQIQSGRSAQSRANMEADALDFQGRMEQDQAQATAARIRREGAEARGAVLGAVAASGVKVGEGSALDAERQVMQDYTQDEYMAILTGDRRALGLKLNADSTRRAGRDAKRAGEINAVTSLLSAGAQGMRAGGWRSNGPGFSGTQKAAPIESRTITFLPGRG